MFLYNYDSEYDSIQEDAFIVQEMKGDWNR